jgi:hypothetical protein
LRVKSNLKAPHQLSKVGEGLLKLNYIFVSVFSSTFPSAAQDAQAALHFLHLQPKIFTKAAIPTSI